MIRYLVLGVLRDGKPRHGYAMMKEHRDATGFQMSIGNFYREVTRLASDGLVRATTNPPGADPRRLPYQITETGIAAFDAWLRVPDVTASADYQDELALRIFLAGQAGEALGVDVLDAWRDELALRRAVLERAATTATTGRTGGEAQRTAVLSLLLSRRLRHIAIDLEVLETFRAMWKDGTGRVAARRQPARANGGRAKDGPPHHRRATA